MEIKTGMELEYKNFLQKNSVDDYSRAVVEYMMRWADMMEDLIENGGLTTALAAAKTEHKADTDGVTGYMYACAVNALSALWKYGDELREWHNSQYDYDGKGVVNPAVIRVDLKG